MKTLLVVLSFTAVSLLAQPPAATGSKTTKKPVATKPAAVAKKPTAAPPAAAIQPVTIPRDAVSNGDGTYIWTDKQGKKWRFVQTPFGVVRSEAATGEGVPNSLAGAKAFDAGDKIRFEKPSPFGTVKWEKNKSDLTDEERRLVDSQLSNQKKQD